MGNAGDQLSHGGQFFGVNQFIPEFGGVRDVRHDYNDAIDVVFLVPHGTKVDGKLASVAVRAHDLQFQVVDLSAAQDGLERVREGTNIAGGRQFKQGMT